MFSAIFLASIKSSSAFFFAVISDRIAVYLVGFPLSFKEGTMVVSTQ